MRQVVAVVCWAPVQSCHVHNLHSPPGLAAWPVVLTGVLPGGPALHLPGCLQQCHPFLTAAVNAKPTRQPVF